MENVIDYQYPKRYVPAPMTASEDVDEERARLQAALLAMHLWHRKWFDWVQDCPLCDPTARPK